MPAGLTGAFQHAHGRPQHALPRIGRAARTHGNLIRRRKAEAANFAAERIRIGAQLFHRALPIILIDAQRHMHRHDITAEIKQAVKAHLPPDLVTDLKRAARRDSLEIGKPIRMVAHDLKGVRAVFLHDLLGGLRSDALDDPGGQVFQNGVRLLGNPLLKAVRL